jgi:hypothetical protein
MTQPPRDELREPRVPAGASASPDARTRLGSPPYVVDGGDPGSETVPALWATLPDALTAAVARGAASDRRRPELPPDLMFRPERLTAEGGPVLRDALARVRWELSALTMFVLGPPVLGLLACLIGAGLVARSRFWETHDKVRALVGIPAAWLMAVVVWAWAQATLVSPASTSGARLLVAWHSFARSMHFGPGVVGLLIAAHLGVLVVRDARWS